MAAKAGFKDKDMQAVIGLVLRAGVIISMAIVILGAVIYLYRHGDTVTDYSRFKGMPDFMRTLSGITEGVFDFRGRAIIQAGIIMLIATPILRVAFSMVSFALEKDYLYVGISSLVLLIILVSMLSGNVG